MAMQVKTRGRVVSGIRRAPSNADMHGQGVVMRVPEFFRALLGARADGPACRGEADLVSVHVRIECGADGLQDARARRLVNRDEDSTEAPEPAHVTDQRGLGHRAVRVDLADVDLRPPTLL